MLSIENALLFVSLLSLNLGFSCWVTYSLPVRIGLAIALLAVVLAIEPWLLQQSLLVWQQQIIPFYQLIAIVLCVESWLAVNTKTHSPRYGLSTLLALLYLQMSVYQSGGLGLPFKQQTWLFIVCLFLLAGLHRLIKKLLGNNYAIRVVCVIALWVITWFSVCQWPTTVYVIESQQYGYTVKLFVALTVIILACVLFEYLHKNIRKKH